MSDKRNTIQYWRRRTLQAGFWVITIAFFWGVDTLTKIQIRNRTGIGKSNPELIVEQATSAGGALLMVGFVVWWLNHFPIRKSKFFPTIMGHIIGSVVFSAGHYFLMIGFRKIAHLMLEQTYGSPISLLSNLIFEYQKDIKIYFSMVIIITIYRQFLGGEKRLQLKPATTKKILVQTGTGESIVSYDQIDYLESARNYVVVHANQHEYLVRDTMAGILRKLSEGRFARAHRSYAINLDSVLEIMTTNTGNKVRLRSGAEVPLSRSFRKEFKILLTQ